jgi:hypothetical protein
LLRKLQLTFNNYRFKLLYRAIDEANDGLISQEDFKKFVLGEEGRSRLQSEEIVLNDFAKIKSRETSDNHLRQFSSDNLNGDNDHHYHQGKSDDESDVSPKIDERRPLGMVMENELLDNPDVEL